MSKQGAVLATKKSARRILVGATTAGVDLGDQWSHYCILDKDGEITEEGRFRTTEGGVATRFEWMIMLELPWKQILTRSGYQNSRTSTDTR